MHWLAWDKISIPKGDDGMGFRDMAAFNVALLGKQGWRLMSSPDSLLAQVLRGRYYHSGDFMNATAPRTASRTWRAILAGREALSQGIIRRVGTGESISIWEHNWIPSSRTLCPLFRPNAAPAEMVSELINQDSKQWDMHSLAANFCQADIDRIIQIPLSTRADEDWLAWAHERSGIYTVKSAYRMLVSRAGEKQARGGSSSSQGQGDLWKRLWSLKVVPKVRVFWWRVMRGIVPDFSTLTRRHVRDNRTCLVCKTTSETLLHALAECHHARMFWTQARDILNVKLPKLHPVRWTADILTESWWSPEERAKVITVMWSI
jgi:hypothetical protein